MNEIIVNLNNSDNKEFDNQYLEEVYYYKIIQYNINKIYKKIIKGLIFK